MKKKTHEEYVKELKRKNPTVEVIGMYDGANKRITHHCLKHDVYWEAIPSNVLYGTGCEMCRKEKFKMIRTKTHSMYLSEIQKVNPTIAPLESYIDASTPILHRCNIHNIEWKVTPDSILRGHGCQKCKSEKIGDSFRKGHEKYVEELSQKHKNIKVIGMYNNANSSILHKCKIDGYEWYAAPANILNGTGCPKCGGTLKLTHDEYIKRLSSINPNIKVIGTYVNIKTPILHKCLIHNTEWSTTPSSTLQGCGCSKCGIENQTSKTRKSLDDYIRELKIINPNIICVDNKYINNSTRLRHKCLVDGHEWYAMPGNLLSGHGCPRCKSSNGEKYIQSWLDIHNIEYESQKRFKDCKDKKPLPFDFYLPIYNSCIEYQGLQHYKSIPYFGGDKSLKILQEHDKIKKEYCANNNLTLLEISYSQNIEEVLNNFLFN